MVAGQQVDDMLTQERQNSSLMPATETEEPCSTSSSADPPGGALSPGKATASERALEKRKAKAQNAMTQDMIKFLAGTMKEQEVTLSSGTAAEKEAARLRRRQLREVQRVCGDTKLPLEERVQYLQAKYSQQISEAVRLEKQLLDKQAEAEALTRERDNAQSELRKASAVSTRLKDLCRQLQKENREVLEECKRRTLEEQQQRQALQQRFDEAINKISSELDTQAAERSKQISDNEALREKLASYLQQADTHELKYGSAIKTLELQVQLGTAKLEEQRALADQSNAKAAMLEVINNNLQLAMVEAQKEVSCLEQMRQHNAALTGSNKALQLELDSYGRRFRDLQGSMAHSNKVLDRLRRDMESQARTHKEQARDLALAKKQRADDQALIVRLQNQLVQAVGITPEPVGAKDDVASLRRQRDQLEQLCRALQAKLKAPPAAAAPAAAAANDDEGAAEGAGAGWEEGSSVAEQQLPDGGINCVE